MGGIYIFITIVFINSIVSAYSNSQKCLNINSSSIFGNDLCGKLLKPSNEEFCSARHQYAVNQFEYNSNIYPSFIVYAKCNKDIQLVLKYASKCDYKVVVRSGGHQYSGLSSCDSNQHQCIQVDLSNYNSMKIISNNPIIIRGEVGVKNSEFADYLDRNDVFLPFGECGSVGLGGHVQTGGYGHIGRIFGGLVDHVIGLNIIYSNGTEHYVTRTNGSDVFWAVLGGNPGSFGVVTYYDFIPFKNSEHSHSSAYKCYWYYDYDTMKSLLNIFYRFIENPTSVDINYNFGLRFVSMRKNFIQFEGAFGDLNGNTTFNDSWFKMFSEIGRPINCEKYINYPMSYLMKDVFAMNIYRESPFPFLKSTHASKTKWHASFVSIFSSQIDKIIKHDKEYGLFMSSQIAFISNGALYRNDPHNIYTSLAHRDMTSFLTTDLFYNKEYNSNAKKIGMQWQDETINLVINNGLFDLNKNDYRMTWCTFDDINISNVYKFYYDSKNDYEIYNKLRQIKTNVDQHNILSNQFTIKPIKYTENKNIINNDPLPLPLQCNMNPKLCECFTIKQVGSTQNDKRVFCSKYKVITTDQCNIIINSFVLAVPHYYCPLTKKDLKNVIVSIEGKDIDSWNVYNDEKIIGIQINIHTQKTHSNINYFTMCINEPLYSGPGVILFNGNTSCKIDEIQIPHWCQIFDLNIIGGPKLDKQLFDKYYDLSVNDNYLFINIDTMMGSDNVYFIFNIFVLITIICIVLLCRKKSKSINQQIL
eukprot:173297_1